MARRDRKNKKEERSKSKGKRGSQDAREDLVNNMVEEIRTIDSEINLLKQKMGLLIREINVLKRVVLSEKQSIKELEEAQEKDDSRFESIINIVRNIRGGKAQ